MINLIPCMRQVKQTGSVSRARRMRLIPCIDQKKQARPALRTRRMHGQMMVFEQVMLFAIGVAIFIICFASFSAYESYFAETGNADQLDQVRDYVAYAIVKSSEGLGVTSSYFTIQIPKSIGGEIYRVNLSPIGLNVTALPSMRYSFTSLYNLGETTEFKESEVMSTSGMIVLYKNGNKIILT